MTYVTGKYLETEYLPVIFLSKSYYIKFIGSIST